jgi:hypothetical protein
MKFIKNSNCLLLIMIFGIKVYLNVKTAIIKLICINDHSFYVLFKIFRI